MSTKTLATVLGIPQLSIHILDREYQLVPYSLGDMSEVQEILREFNAATEARADWLASVKRWEKANEAWWARVDAGEGAGPNIGPKPAKPEIVAKVDVDATGIVRLLWTAIRKSGLSREQIRAKAWAISEQDVFEDIPFERIGEVNELMASFFQREKKTQAPAETKP